MMFAPDITQERLKESLSYDAETGMFRWATRMGQRGVVGKRAGSVNKILGYVLIKIDGRLYRAHRLVWLYVFGRFPLNDIDHINGLRSDNRLSNLRECTRAENQMNRKKSLRNSSGFKGVSFKDGKWRARVGSKGKRRSLGYYDTPEEAHLAYRSAAAKLHGDFARFE